MYTIKLGFIVNVQDHTWHRAIGTPRVRFLSLVILIACRVSAATLMVARKHPLGEYMWVCE